MKRYIVSTLINEQMNIYNNFICYSQEKADEVARQFKEAEIEIEEITINELFNTVHSTYRGTYDR